MHRHANLRRTKRAFLLAVLNSRMGGRVAVEDPCYPEARNAFSLAGNRIFCVPVVAHPDIISEAKAIRRTIMRHPPGLLQEAMAGFIGSGFLDAHLRRMERRFRMRWEITLDAMHQYLPKYRIQASQGGTSIRVTAPDELDSSGLARRLRKRGVVIDEGGIFFNDPSEGRRSFRLGFAALSKTVIHEGIRIIAEEARQ